MLRVVTLIFIEQLVSLGFERGDVELVLLALAFGGIVLSTMVISGLVRAVSVLAASIAFPIILIIILYLAAIGC